MLSLIIELISPQIVHQKAKLGLGPAVDPTRMKHDLLLAPAVSAVLLVETTGPHGEMAVEAGLDSPEAETQLRND